MRKTLWKVGLSSAVVLLMSSSAYAQATANAALNVTVTVNSRARLTLGRRTSHFADADPATDPTLTRHGLTVDVGARTAPAGNVTLTVLATGDLASGTDTIAIGNLTWTATGTRLRRRASNATVAQTVGAWTGSGARAGSQTYSLAKQLGVRARHVRHVAELHADSSLAASRKTDTIRSRWQMLPGSGCASWKRSGHTDMPANRRIQNVRVAA